MSIKLNPPMTPFLCIFALLHCTFNVAASSGLEYLPTASFTNSTEQLHGTCAQIGVIALLSCSKYSTSRVSSTDSVSEDTPSLVYSKTIADQTLRPSTYHFLVTYHEVIDGYGSSTVIQNAPASISSKRGVNINLLLNQL
jgi:hypothetical protein